MQVRAICVSYTRLNNQQNVPYGQPYYGSPPPPPVPQMPPIPVSPLSSQSLPHTQYAGHCGKLFERLDVIDKKRQLRSPKCNDTSE